MFIAVIDCGIGNLHSVKQALLHAVPGSPRVEITNQASVIDEADKVVFPGQGAARDCMAAIRLKQLAQPLLKAASEKPFLGICLGLQVLFDYSAENEGTQCLGLLNGTVQYLGAAARHRQSKIPHMGWNCVKQTRAHPLWQGVADNEYFYFVHSFYIVPADNTVVTGCTEYGIDFACAVATQSVFAVQFHPEKSARYGLHLLKNFATWNGAV